MRDEKINKVHPDVEAWLEKQYRNDINKLREQHRKNMLDRYGIVID